MMQTNTLDSQTPSKPLTDLHNVIEKCWVECGIPGMSVAVLHKGELIFAEGFGKRNEQGDPFEPMTLCPIGSQTKSFTAAAIGELVAEGKLDWDTKPVSKYLPEFELKDPTLTSQLTFVDLLSHRLAVDNCAEAAFYRCAESRPEIIQRLKHADLNSKLGTKVNYSNMMYTVAGEAAARVAGMSYEDVVREKVIRPLGLNNTGFSQTEMRDQSPNHAMPFSVRSFEDAQKGDFNAEKMDEVYMTYAPAGDMYSNVLDLVKWGRVVIKGGELDGKQVLNKESLQETLKPQTIMQGGRRGPEYAPMVNYGLGWCIDSYKGHANHRHGKDQFEEEIMTLKYHALNCHHTLTLLALFAHGAKLGGIVWGYSCGLTVFPDDDLVVAVLSNLVHNGLTHYLQFHIADEVLDLPKTRSWIPDLAIQGTKGYYEQVVKGSAGEGKVPELIENRPPTHPLASYVGEYLHSLYGTVSVTMDETGVEGKQGLDCLSFSGFGFSAKMKHHHFDLFLMTLSDPSGTNMALATFRIGADGNVESVVVDYEGKSEFRKQGETKESTIA
ncbi:hypothetical protein BGZ70_009108 [Mortierella alpina]|uniref:Beta-lactamase/transpeptidase-like protein n=1 Tax=Mortierella alpina TaxID=64518 RepID=A0A9P6J5A9_MORAP|nr:hypothetical protein BGZ70_009108 [Mortierella alpina]